MHTWNDIKSVLNLFSHSSNGITHCEYCKQEFKDPTELQCGHIFCKDCLEEKNAEKCLKCQKDITERKPCDPGKRCVLIIVVLFFFFFAVMVCDGYFCNTKYLVDAIYQTYIFITENNTKRYLKISGWLDFRGFIAIMNTILPFSFQGNHWKTQQIQKEVQLFFCGISLEVLC